MSERRYTIKEIRTADERAHVRFLKAQVAHLALFARGEKSKSKMPELINLTVQELEALPAPKEFEREVWSNRMLEQMSKPGATWHLIDEETGHYPHDHPHALTVTYRNGHAPWGQYDA